MRNAIELEFQLRGELWTAYKDFLAKERERLLDDIDSIQPIDEESRYEREKAIIKRQVLAGMTSTFEREVQDSALKARKP